MDGDSYSLTWERLYMGGTALDRWAVRLVDPHLPVVFATGSYPIRPADGKWLP
jgi:hypothetical protein